MTLFLILNQVCTCVHVCACVCVCVCLCVCLCVEALHPKRMNGFWWNFLQMIWQTFAKSVFLGFCTFEIDDVMAAILYFFVRALSRSQFCSDCLQNCRRGRKLFSAVCHLRSARLASSFCQYGKPRFRKKKSKWLPKVKILKQGKWGVYFDWNWPADHEYGNI